MRVRTTLTIAILTIFVSVGLGAFLAYQFNSIVSGLIEVEGERYYRNDNGKYNKLSKETYTIRKMTKAELEELNHE